jgi:hypothetical protein
MVPLITDPSLVGSWSDLATLVVVTVMLVMRLRPRVATIAAAVVALAEERRDVDADRLRDELEVGEREVEALRPTIVRGEDSDG